MCFSSGHLSSKHGQFGHWIYRVRQSWYQLLAGLETRGQHTERSSVALMIATASLIGSGLFVLFFRWYAPFFAAYSFVLARADEYEADQYAAKLTGARNLASALVNLELKGGYRLPDFWDSIAAKVDKQVDPPEPYAELESAMQQPFVPAQVKPWLKAALARQTTTDDTHPCLKDRLHHIGCKPEQTIALLNPSQVSAAAQLLGPAQAKLVQHFNQEWQQAIAPQWRERYKERQRLQQTLEALNDEPETSLSVENRWRLASVTAELKGVEAALPDIKAVLAENPDHPNANGLFGQILMAKGDRIGIQHLEKVMMKDVSTFTQYAQLIYTFLQQYDSQTAADQYLETARQQRDALAKA